MRFVFRDGEGHWRNGWKALGSVLLTAVLGGGLLWLRGLLPSALREAFPSPWDLFLGALLASLFCLRLERRSLASIGLSLGRRAGRDLGLGVLGGIVLVGTVAFLVGISGGFHLVWAEAASASVLMKAAWMMLGVALFEETLFHGHAFQRAIDGLGVRWAQVLLSVIFCLAHPFSAEMAGSTKAVAMLCTFLAGWMLGLCYLRTGHLALPVGVHLGWNWMLGCMGFGVSGNDSKGFWTPVFHDRPEWFTGGRYGLEGSIVAVAVLGLAVVALTRWKGFPPPVTASGSQLDMRGRPEAAAGPTV
ncbi:CPBP family intramembrane metalloprotease [Corallococcus praedator]|uniref:CPBP family intramembrane metalloprotease n=1 Tax=Corallococcus praedator TaxID=2316724 RepID=A0ABX9Q793_9BACT|nr:MULTISPECIES: CPBP family intramembrane glutamic endopeptidase [Corallococcus]RKH20687.1 CPBP family intramembrane metalloprotease [Corallococcus sp. CA031C]RKH92839.1 CPBP family intramembrane metalloprotease [Corallococcus praedator]